jgi:hypothetical protein
MTETMQPLATQAFVRNRPSPWSYLGSGLAVALRSPSILLLLLVFSLLLPLVVVVPVYQSSVAELGHVQALPGQAPIDLPNSAPAWLWHEWHRADADVFQSVASYLPWLVFIAAMWNLLVTGGWMHVGLATQRRPRARAFFQGGLQNFLPFFRVWLIGVPVLSTAAWAIWAAPGGWVMAQFLPEGNIDFAATELAGRIALNVRSVIFISALLQIEILLDLARAFLIVGPSQSALKATWRGLKSFACHPVRIYSLVLGSFALEFVWIAGVEFFRQAFELPLATLLILLPLGRQALRGGRYVALARFSHDD